MSDFFSTTAKKSTSETFSIRVSSPVPDATDRAALAYFTTVSPSATSRRANLWPRGIASVLYLTLMIDELGLAGHETVVAVVSLTVLLSILAHGASATPLAAAYGRRQTGSR